ncbi:MAG: 3-keto-5-aminohexanoate cleavage protein, partial [Candidatus Binatia bacterium]
MRRRLRGRGYGRRDRRRGHRHRARRQGDRADPLQRLRRPRRGSRRAGGAAPRRHELRRGRGDPRELSDGHPHARGARERPARRPRADPWRCGRRRTRGGAALPHLRGGDHRHRVRVGLEDYSGPGQPRNAELVGGIVALAARHGRPIATAAEAA